MWTFENVAPAGLRGHIQRLLDTERPDVAERTEADVAHDVWDRWWDTLDREERLNLCAALRWLILHPEFLIDKYGMDVVSGRALTELPNGDLEWQNEPHLNRAWRELRVYVDGRPLEDLLVGR
jgi:hypothetical protein